MKRLIRSADHFLQKKSPRYKLWRICRAVGIRPYKWQRYYALYPLRYNRLPSGRCNGKTVAVMLRLFTHSHYAVISRELEIDPDFIITDYRRIRWYKYEFKKMGDTCAAHGILVPVLTFPDAHRVSI